ncbi:MAG: hypothetical protein NTZ32_00675 [Planctomycetales bacterium]|nr:hypothetical protein [Planctomycetales bacterium]
MRDRERTDWLADWLIVAHNPATGETKYFVSNAHSDTPLDRLLRIAFPRWNIEHLFRVGKSELGFSHFEGRSYVSLIRHTTLDGVPRRTNGSPAGKQIPRSHWNKPAAPWLNAAKSGRETAAKRPTSNNPQTPSPITNSVTSPQKTPAKRK